MLDGIRKSRHELSRLTYLRLAPIRNVEPRHRLSIASGRIPRMRREGEHSRLLEIPDNQYTLDDLRD